MENPGLLLVIIHHADERCADVPILHLAVHLEEQCHKATNNIWNVDIRYIYNIYLTIFIDTYIDDGSGKREYDGQEPDEDGDLLGLGGGAEILRLHGVHHRVVSTTITSLYTLNI